MNAAAHFNERRRALAGVRIESRICVAAARELERLAVENRCSRSDVVDGLLLGTIRRAPIDPEIASAMIVHGFSLSEAEEFAEHRR